MCDRRIEMPERRRHEASGRLRRSLMAAAAALPISTLPVWAMDCGKAAGAIETAICADPALKAQDARLGRLYFATLKTLSGRRHDTLIEDQRIWLAERSDECASAAAERSACIDRVTSARIARITACYAGATPKPTAGTSCAVAAHASCPRSRMSASVQAWAYPFLVAKLEAQADADRKGEADADLCSPESKDRPGAPDDNNSDYEMTIEGAGAGWVAVRSELNADARGAAHPFHVETAETYEVPTGKVLAITKLLPGLATDKAAAEALWAAAKAPASKPCCGEETPSLTDVGDDSRFAGETDAAGHPLPVAWSVQPNGGLKIFYNYDMLGRGFLAAAVVKRSVFIGWVDRRYMPLFAKPQ